MVKLRGQVWYARIGVPDTAGKRVQKWIRMPDCKTERQAKKEEMQLRAQTEAVAAPVVTTPPTLETFMLDWLAYTKAERAAQTYETYRDLATAYLLPSLGDCRLDQLAAADIRAAYTHLRTSGRCSSKGGLSEQTLLHCHRLLNQVLTVAVADGLIAKNPMATVKAPVPVWHTAHFLDEEGVRRLLHASAGNRLYLPIMLAVTAGLRRGEVLALRWDRLDLERGTLTVNLAMEHPVSGIGYKLPKSRSGRRTILLLPLTLAALRQHREATLQKGGAAANHEDGLVVSQPDGSPITPGALTQAFRLFLRRAGLPAMRFHDLRHTHVALLIKQNTSMKAISTRLGHAGIGITMDTYGHLLPGVEEEAVGRLDQVLQTILPE